MSRLFKPPSASAAEHTEGFIAANDKEDRGQQALKKIVQEASTLVKEMQL